MSEIEKPSEVFMILWRYRTTHDDTETPDDFAMCAEAWAEIREMENKQRFEAFIDPRDVWPELVGHPDPRGEPGEPGVPEREAAALQRERETPAEPG